MSQHVMIDIETLGTGADSAIASIGAVAFDDTSLGAEFYAVVDLDSCFRAGLKPEGRTIRWWMEQSEPSRLMFSEDGIDLRSALRELSVAFDWTGTNVWCNGLNFDIPILDTAYRNLGMPSPWRYYDCRDFRTIKGMFSRQTWGGLKVEPTVAHNALEDAKAQAQTLQRVWMSIKEGQFQWAA